jgi:hypothetical protein
MINAVLNLYILIFNQETSKYDILSIDKKQISVPNILLDDKTNINDELSNLFIKYVDLSSDYVVFKISDAEIIGNKLHIVYYCVPPFNTKIKNSFLLPYYPNEIIFTNLQKIIKLL